MRDLENELKELYSKKVTSLEYEGKDEIMKLFDETKRTSAGKKIIFFRVAMVALICAAAVGVCAVGATAAGLDLAGVIFDKTENTDLTDQEKMDLANELESLYQDVTEKDIALLENLPDLQTNEYGVTYGSLQLGAELFEVISDDDEIGYVYKNDYIGISGFEVSNPDEAIAHTKAMEEGTIRNWVYVYESDGKTIIGKLILGPTFTVSDAQDIEEAEDESYPEWYAENYGEGQKYGFVTNDDLENEVIQSELHDGADAEDYEAEVQARTEALTTE